MKRANWASRSTFILAAVGSAVGLGNAWRFPGLVAKHGGGAFLLVYLFAMLVLGVPLLTMEIAIGRKMKKGAPNALRGISKKGEYIGWGATANAFLIACYYAAVFGWILLMMVMSFKFAGMTANTDAASTLWENTIQTTWGVDGLSIISWPTVLAILAAWGFIYYCIRNGAHSVSKVVKFTVFAPVVIMVIMAIKGLTMPGAGEAMFKLFIPDFAALKSSELWVDAVGQVFYSLSIMMAIMFAYGSYLDDSANIAVDALIIAFSDMAISVLAGIVMFSTMGGVGMLDNMSTSGIATAFKIYPMAIVSMTNIGWFNAFFGVLFYLCLATLAIDSAFSIVEGVSSAVSDKFNLNPKKTTITICIIAGLISLVFATGAGVGWLDIVDNWTNQYNMLIVGILEAVLIGWFFKTSKVLDEVNRNTIKYKMPGFWFNTSIKVIAPVLLTVLLVWNLRNYFTAVDPETGSFLGYGGYPMYAQIIGGWAITIFSIISGFIIRIIVKSNKRFKALETKEKSWDEV